MVLNPAALSFWNTSNHDEAPGYLLWHNLGQYFTRTTRWSGWNEVVAGKIPEAVNLGGVYHDALATDLDGIFIPSDLRTSEG